MAHLTENTIIFHKAKLPKTGSWKYEV